MCRHVVDGACALAEKCQCHPHQAEVVALHPLDRRLIRLMQSDDPDLTVQECLTFIRGADKETNTVGYRLR